jgi:hypothetical protein
MVTDLCHHRSRGFKFSIREESRRLFASFEETFELDHLVELVDLLDLAVDAIRFTNGALNNPGVS